MSPDSLSYKSTANPPLVDPSYRDSGPGSVHIRIILWRATLVFIILIVLGLSTNLATKIVQYIKTPSEAFQKYYLIEVIYHRSLWLSVTLIAGTLAWFRVLPAVVIWLICILVVELGSTRMHLYLTGQTFPRASVYAKMYTPHPLLQFVPHPGKFGRYTHTEDNLRLTVNRDKKPKASLISAYGGSTTYEVAVNDGDTWPSRLSQILGGDYVVENHGVPGYSTVEHIIQASFDFRKRKPKCAIYYIGWNDIRNSNFTDLRPDYSNFQLITQAAIAQPISLLERRSALLSIISYVGNRRLQLRGRVEHEYDQRLSAIFKDNVKLIAAITKHFGVKPIFVPQVLNYEHLTATEPYGWSPFVVYADMEHLMSAMNTDLELAARESGSLFLGEPLRVNWMDGDFADDGHFRPQGSEKFAMAIAQGINTECR
jgi:lysophospholipase L1-like esterase